MSESNSKEKDPKNLDNNSGREGHPEIESEAIDRVERYPEAPDDFTLDDESADLTPVSELGEIVEVKEPEGSENKIDRDVSEDSLEEEGVSEEDCTPDVETSESQTAKIKTVAPAVDDQNEDVSSQKDEAEQILIETQMDQAESDRSGGKTIPVEITSSNGEKTSESSEFQLHSITPALKDEEIYPVPDDQRQIPMKIFCADDVYSQLMEHACEGLENSPGGQAFEVKGVLMGSAVIDQYPIIVINGVLKLPASPEDQNDQCSFGAVEDEIIRRKLEELPKGMSVVGYYHSHPDHPVFLSDFDVSMHNRRCTAPWKIAVVVQPREKEIGFFVKQPDHGQGLQSFVHAQQPSLKIYMDEQGKVKPDESEDRHSDSHQSTPVVQQDPNHSGRDVGRRDQGGSLAEPSSKKKKLSRWPLGIITIGMVVLVMMAAGWLVRQSGRDSDTNVSVSDPGQDRMDNKETSPNIDKEKEDPDQSYLSFDDTSSASPETQKKEPEKSILLIKTDPQGCKIIVDDEEWESGQSSVEIPPGSHKIRVSAEGYHTEDKRILIKPGNNIHDITLNKKKIRKKPVPDKPKRGQIQLICSEENVDVFLDGEISKLKGKKKNLLTNISPGKHQIIVKKEGFKQYQKSLEFPGPDKSWKQSLTIELIPVKPTPTPILAVKIVTDPSGADVYIDGEKQTGSTPQTFEGISAGRHEISIKKEGYENKVFDQYEISPESNPSEISINLEKLPPVSTPTPDRTKPILRWEKKPPELHNRAEPITASVSLEYWPDLENLKVVVVYVYGENKKSKRLATKRFQKTASGGMKGTFEVSFKSPSSFESESMEMWIEVLDKSRKDILMATLSASPIRLVGK